MTAATFFPLALAGLLSGRAVFAVFLGLGTIAMLLSGGVAAYIGSIVKILKTPVGYLSVLTLCIWSASSIGSAFPAQSFSVLARMPAFLILAAMIYTFYCAHPHLRNLSYRVLAIGLFFVAFIAVATNTFWPEALGYIKAREFANTWWAQRSLKSYGSVAAMASVFLIWFSFQKEHAIERKIAGVSALGLIAMVFLLQSRAGVLGMISALLLCGIVIGLRKRDKASAMIGTGLVVVIGAAIAMVFYQFDFGADLTLEGLFVPGWLVDPHRQLIWEQTILLGLERPWFGWGVDTVNLVYDAKHTVADLVTKNGEAVKLIPGHPHNWLLEVFAETGLVGTLPILVIVGYIVWRPLRLYISSGNNTHLAVLGVSAAFWSSSLVNFSFWSAWWQMAYLLLVVSVAANVPEEASADAGE